MDKVTIQTDKLGKTFSFSPEHWLSIASANSMDEGCRLDSVARLQKKGTSSFDESVLVLDTGNSDRGLFVLPFATGDGRAQRISNKKIVPEGSVLISRLRPYLQQVLYVPNGICKLLGVSGIVCSTEYYVLESSEPGRHIGFLVPWLLSKGVQTVFDQATTGGHHPRFNDDLLLRLTIPDRVLSSRDEVSSQVDDLVVSHVQSQLNMGRLISNATD